MTTLYIRDVSEDVAETLKERAAAEGKSLSAYVGAELTRIATRPTKPLVVALLRSRAGAAGPTAAETLVGVRAGRR
ncbi:FitA-like ribbon-helix-helix domain-containing protein [Phycicoccus elongatus]|uniref:FitA-like ribbon-helix-helix domain-containing protein n=1 Tax=Phycicoccus elongatus TaxID=101689 RepID=UPI0037840AF2